MKLRVASLSAVLLLATSAAAHDVWIQPRSFAVDAGKPLPVEFLIGHGQSRDRWANNDRIVLLVDRWAGGSRDIRGDLRSQGSADLVTKFAKPGLHVVAMQSSYAVSELPAIRFNDYAEAEGLTTILSARERAGTMKEAGRERYSRRGKALIRVGGSAAGGRALATRPVGLKLEIVPEVDPYALGASRMLPVHVLYNKRRLAGATVKLTNLAHDAEPVATAVTDKSGRAVFKVPATGNWLLNVIWADAVKGNQRFDFDTTFSSLTFGY